MMNQSSNDSSVNNRSVHLDPAEGLSPTAAVILGTGLGIEASMAILGNLIVLWSFRRDKNLRIPRFFYIFNLCLCDFVRGMIVVPIATVDLLSGQQLPSYYCKYGVYVSYTLFSESVLSIILISSDRFLMVKDSFSYMRNETNRRTGVKIGLSWLVSIIWNAVTVLCWHHIEPDGNPGITDREICTADYEHSQHIYLFSIIEFMLPLMIIAGLNIATYCFISNTKRMKGRSESERQSGFSFTLTTGDSRVERFRSRIRAKSRRSHYNPTSVTTLRNTSVLEYESCQPPGETLPLKSQHQFDSEGRTNSPSPITQKRLPSPLCSQVVPSASSERSIANLRRSGKTVNFSMRKIGKSLAILVGIYCVCWIPNVLCIVISRACSNCFPIVWHVLAAFINYLDPALNPVIYGLSHKRFAKNFKDILCFFKS